MPLRPPQRALPPLRTRNAEKGRGPRFLTRVRVLYQHIISSESNGVAEPMK